VLAARSPMSKIAVACRTLERLAAEPPARSSGWLPFRHVTRGGRPRRSSVSAVSACGRRDCS
jgi:hypothetical protein